MQTRISLCSEQGPRSWQEDSYGLFRIGSWECFAVADGFGSQHHQQDSLSDKIIAELLPAALAALANHPHLTKHNSSQLLSNIFEQIDHATSHYLTGSTLALAFHHRSQPIFYTAALGDSIIAHLSPKQFTTNPSINLHLSRENLWGAFGDTYHASFHSKQPECHTFHLEPSDVLLIATDGLFSHPNRLQQELAEYQHAACHQQATAAELVALAHQHQQSTDNATAILIQPPSPAAPPPAQSGYHLHPSPPQ